MNKLYEEADIQAIANAIRAKNGSADTYMVSEMANEISNLQMTTEENRIVFSGTITETYVGSGKYVTLAKSDKLAEIRNEKTLFVRVGFDIEPTQYTVVKTWGQGSIGIIPMDTAVNKQFVLRYDANAENSSMALAFGLSENETITSGVGRLYITEDGELRCYSNSSSNYAIRPSNWKAIIEW